MFYLVAAIVLVGVLVFVVYGLPSRNTGPIVPEGLSFTNPFFELVVNQNAETVTVRAENATHRTPATHGVPERRLVDLTFPAVGFTAVVNRDTRAAPSTGNRRRAVREPDVYTPNPVKPAPDALSTPLGKLEETGFSTIVFVSPRHPFAQAGSSLATEKDIVEITQVSNAAAELFKTRFASVSRWVTDVEARLRAEAKAQSEARAHAQTKAEHALEHLRPACDFKPTHEDMDFDAAGNVLWAIKLHAGGRCWIHAEGKTYLGTLGGGKATLRGDGLEVMVRDSKWETTYFARRKMKLFTGAEQAKLAAWMERINALTKEAQKAGQNPN